jgi:hypothetical protein
MAAPVNSLFAPFDFENYQSLLRLQPGLWTCLGGGTNLSYGRIKYTEEEENTIRATAERMKRSPLLHEIIKFFMDFPIYDAPHLIAVGKQLLQFATVDAEDPALPGYQRAVKAWEDREVKLTKDFTDDVSYQMPLHIMAADKSFCRRILQVTTSH